MKNTRRYQLTIYDLCPGLLGESNFDDIPEAAVNREIIDRLYEQEFSDNSEARENASTDFSAETADREADKFEIHCFDWTN